MSYRPFGDEEEVLVLSTDRPMPHWLKRALQALGILLFLGLLVGALVGWRYVAVRQKVKQDLARVIGHEEEIRAMGGVNAAQELVLPTAASTWRFRYLSSVRARQGRPIPDLVLEKVTYDGEHARVFLQVDGLAQQRAYQLYRGAWRRAPFQASGWGARQEEALPEGVTLVYWETDADFAQALTQDVPSLLAIVQALGLAPTPQAHRLVILPQEFGDHVRPGQKVTGLVINSPHVDWIPQEPGTLGPVQELRLALARAMLTDARKAQGGTSVLPGAARIQAGMDEVMAWAWAVGGVTDDAVWDWSKQLKGEWVSPAQGLPPELMAKLQPNAPEIAARLMMTVLYQREGLEALVALNAAMQTATTWDEAYDLVAGLSESQLEVLARQLAREGRMGE